MKDFVVLGIITSENIRENNDLPLMDSVLLTAYFNI